MDETDLLRSAHHAVRSPLGSILNVTEMMLLGMDGILTLSQRTGVSSIVEDAQKLHRVGELLLEYVRVVESPIQSYPVDMHEMMRAVVEKARSHNALTLTLLMPVERFDCQTNPDHLYAFVQRALDLLKLAEPDTSLGVLVEVEKDRWHLHFGEPAVAVPSLPDYLLLTGEGGILFLVCRQFARLLGGMLKVSTSPEGKLSLSATFPRNL